VSGRKNPAALANMPTRRQVIAGVTITFGSLAAGSGVWAKPQQKMAETQSTGAEGLLTYLHQEIDIKASPQRIYDALLDSKQFSAFSGEPAEINREVGGAFSMFGGKIVGRNIELVPNQRIVQAWRPANWDPGVYSIVKFELKEHGSQTKVVLDHTGFPEGAFRHLASGWYERYWEPLKKFLA
jgi:activator of HSP90 ATPase